MKILIAREHFLLCSGLLMLVAIWMAVNTIHHVMIEKTVKPCNNFSKLVDVPKETQLAFLGRSFVAASALFLSGAIFMFVTGGQGLKMDPCAYLTMPPCSRCSK